MKVAEKQAVLNVIQKEITLLSQELSFKKVEVKTYYNLSIKEDPSTFQYFKQLNYTQSQKRSLKNKISRLAAIAKNLKTEISRGVNE